jgi:hypothetical protein
MQTIVMQNKLMVIADVQIDLPYAIVGDLIKNL